jgi:hypothetical protein
VDILEALRQGGRLVAHMVVCAWLVGAIRTATISASSRMMLELEEAGIQEALWPHIDSAVDLRCRSVRTDECMFALYIHAL